MSDEIELHTTEIPATLEVRDLAKRELGVLMVPWDTMVDTPQGREQFKRGAFAHIDPSQVRLRMDHENPITGRGIALEERADAAYMTFKVSKTQRGDDQLTLASDGSVSGASVGFQELPGGTAIESIDGRRVRVHHKVDLREVSTTWMPAYERASVTFVRSQGDTVAEPTPDPTPEPPQPDPGFAVESAMTAMGNSLQKFSDQFAERLEKMEERSRSQFTVPAPEADKPKVTRGEWFDTVLHALSGDRVPDLQMRALADLVTSDNMGIVPDAFSSELIGVIDDSRPFMSSTRKLPTPPSGLKLVVPVITQRPIVGLQSEEKAELASQKTTIDTVDFDMVTKGGAGDISLQLLKRADRSFLDLYLQLLAEALAIESETEAVEALLGADVNDGNTLDPNDLSLGAAYTTSFDAIRRPPDTIWLSSEAVGAFIDAKASGTNAPLYSNITASATAGGGINGSISGLRAVHVPVLNGAGADVIIGPSNGFAWAEDGSYTLQVDVPSRAGRDVALVSMYWFAPWYPTAFTVYSLTS